MERHGRKFERQADGQHQAAQHQYHFALGKGPGRHRGQLRDDRRQMGRTGRTGQQADTVEHHAGGTRAENRVFKRRFAALPAPFENSRQGVRRHAGHLDPQENHQQMIRRGHDAHAQRGAENERVEVRPILGIGNARQACHHQKQHGENQQHRAEIDGKPIEQEHAGEDLGRVGAAARDRFAAQITPGGGQGKCGHRARQGNIKRRQSEIVASGPTASPRS